MCDSNKGIIRIKFLSFGSPPEGNWNITKYNTVTMLSQKQIRPTHQKKYKREY